MSGNMKSRSAFKLKRVIQLFLIAYLLIALLVMIFQRRLIYLPTKIPAGVIESVAAGHGFGAWKNEAGEIIGWKMTRTNATASVLIFHGNAGCALSRDYLAQPIFDAADVSVFVLEYPGYGARGGSPGKDSFIATAKSAFEQLPKNLPRYLVSESLGAGVACELARAHPQDVAGMALFVPYHNLASVAQRQFWFLPAYLFLRDRFDPEECLKSYRGPVKFIIAEKDEIIGAASGIRLHASYQGVKEIQIFPKAGHNEVAGQPVSWWREVFGFWSTSRTATTK